MRQIQHPSLDQTGVVPGGPQTVTGDTKLKIPASSIDISRPSAESNTKPKKKAKKKNQYNEKSLRPEKQNRGAPARRPSSVRFPDAPSPLGSLVPTNDGLAILDGLRDLLRTWEAVPCTLPWTLPLIFFPAWSQCSTRVRTDYGGFRTGH